MKAGAAYDLLLVETSIDTGVSCSEALYGFGPDHCSMKTDDPTVRVELLVFGKGGKEVSFPVRNNFIQNPASKRKGGPTSQHDIQALKVLKSYLKPGKNAARYLLIDQDNVLVGVASMNIFLWMNHSKILIMDVDGTVTRSTLSGFFSSAIYENFDCCHDGVCRFLSSLPDDIHVLYLTARPMSYANITRRLLTDLKQGKHSLPAGAMIGYTGTLWGVVSMDMIYHNAHEHKIQILQRYILKPFEERGSRTTFWAGFGNSLMDMRAYYEAGLELSRAYIIDKKSRIYALDKKSTQPKTTSDFKTAYGTLFRAGFTDPQLLPHVVTPTSSLLL